MSLSAWGSAALVVVGVLLWRPPAAWLLSARLDLRAPGAGASAARRLGPVGAVVAGLLLVPWLVDGSSDGWALGIVLVTAVIVAAFAVGRVRAARRRAGRAATRARVCAALELLAADLRSGVLPGRALAGLVPDTPELAAAARAADLGHDVPAALRTAAHGPGAEPLQELAASWQVAERSGAPMSQVLERLVSGVRDDAEVAREVRAEAAPARATGRLMAALPVLGLSLGAGLGTDPVHLLTRTVPGALCLAAGSALACAGLAWIDRIADAAEADA